MRLEGFELIDLRFARAPEWIQKVEPLRAALEELVGGSHAQSKAGNSTIKLHWVDGPSTREVAQHTTELVGELPDDQDAPEDLQWQNLTVELHRTWSPAARGYALLSAALAGTCGVCTKKSTFREVYGAQLEGAHPERYESHHNLAGLEALGVRRQQLEELAELLGGLHEDTTEAIVLHHRRGHLAGLAQLAETIHS